MSAIDYLHSTPEDRYAAASVANDVPAPESRLRRYLRDTPALLALLAAAIGLLALRVWVYLPANIHLHG
ncbi:MAG TPA: hypothetical protein VMC10_19625 [Stellaceae bacterium]|nr:hypothetical protein [Stellaceae bacterium]